MTKKSLFYLMASSAIFCRPPDPQMHALLVECFQDSRLKSDAKYLPDPYIAFKDVKFWERRAFSFCSFIENRGAKELSRRLVHLSSGRLKDGIKVRHNIKDLVFRNRKPVEIDRIFKTLPALAIPPSADYFISRRPEGSDQLPNPYRLQRINYEMAALARQEIVYIMYELSKVYGTAYYYLANDWLVNLQNWLAPMALSRVLQVECARICPEIQAPPAWNWNVYPLELMERAIDHDDMVSAAGGELKLSPKEQGLTKFIQDEWKEFISVISDKWQFKVQPNDSRFYKELAKGSTGLIGKAVSWLSSQLGPESTAPPIHLATDFAALDQFLKGQFGELYTLLDDWLSFRVPQGAQAFDKTDLKKHLLKEMESIIEKISKEVELFYQVFINKIADASRTIDVSLANCNILWVKTSISGRLQKEEAELEAKEKELVGLNEQLEAKAKEKESSRAELKTQQSQDSLTLLDHGNRRGRLIHAIEQGEQSIDSCNLQCQKAQEAKKKLEEKMLSLQEAQKQLEERRIKANQEIPELTAKLKKLQTNLEAIQRFEAGFGLEEELHKFELFATQYLLIRALCLKENEEERFADFKKVMRAFGPKAYDHFKSMYAAASPVREKIQKLMEEIKELTEVIAALKSLSENKACDWIIAPKDRKTLKSFGIKCSDKWTQPLINYVAEEIEEKKKEVTTKEQLIEQILHDVEKNSDQIEKWNKLQEEITQSEKVIAALEPLLQEPEGGQISLQESQILKSEGIQAPGVWKSLLNSSGILPLNSTWTQSLIDDVTHKIEDKKAKQKAIEEKILSKETIKAKLLQIKKEEEERIIKAKAVVNTAASVADPVYDLESDKRYVEEQYSERSKFFMDCLLAYYPNSDTVSLYRNNIILAMIPFLCGLGFLYIAIKYAGLFCFCCFLILMFLSYVRVCVIFKNPS